MFKMNTTKYVGATLLLLFAVIESSVQTELKVTKPQKGVDGVAPESNTNKTATGEVNVDVSQDETSFKTYTGELPDKSLSNGAAIRGFYVLLGIGVIVVIFISVKAMRLRRKQVARKYKVLSRSDDQEMFPLAADEGDDEEIFNAANILPGEHK